MYPDPLTPPPFPGRRRTIDRLAFRDRRPALIVALDGRVADVPGRQLHWPSRAGSWAQAALQPIPGRGSSRASSVRTESEVLPDAGVI
jgi:hypothetical protein